MNVNIPSYQSGAQTKGSGAVITSNENESSPRRKSADVAVGLADETTTGGLNPLHWVITPLPTLIS